MFWIHDLAPAGHERAALVLAAALDERDARRHAVDDIIEAGETVVHERIAAIASDREEDGNLAYALRHLQIRVRAVVEDAHRLQIVVATHPIVEIELVDRGIGQRCAHAYPAPHSGSGKSLLRILRIEKADPRHRIVVT